MPNFTHDGIHFHYERRGSGPTLVMTHGLTGDCEVIKRLLEPCDGIDLIVWDCRGHGRTEPVGDEGSFSFRTFASDLNHLLSHLGVQRATVGGVSMGAGITVRLALQRPELVSAMILIRPAWLDRGSPAGLRSIERVGELLKSDTETNKEAALEADPDFQQMRERDPMAATQTRQLLHDPRGIDRCARLLKMPRDRPIVDWSEVERLTMPALVIGCNADYVHPIEYAHEWVRRLPHASFVEVPAKSQSEAQYQSGVCSAVMAFINEQSADNPQ